MKPLINPLHDSAASGTCHWAVAVGFGCRAAECENGGGPTQPAPACGGTVNGTCAANGYQYCFRDHGAVRDVSYEYWTSGTGASGKSACSLVTEGVKYWGCSNDEL